MLLTRTQRATRVFVAEEDSPGVREYDLTTGTELQSVAIPNVFTNRRSNFGFESLTRSPDGSTMWTGNEEALTVDGPRSTASAGTTVRLLRIECQWQRRSGRRAVCVSGRPHPRWRGLASQRRSGLSDLVALPDGTLLALERSFDVIAQYVPGLSEQCLRDRLHGGDRYQCRAFQRRTDRTKLYTRHQGTSLGGDAAGANGQNLEGLALGPRLPNGNWLLVGVVDNPMGDRIQWSLQYIGRHLSFRPNPTATLMSMATWTAETFSLGNGASAHRLVRRSPRATRTATAMSMQIDLAVWSAAYGSPSVAATVVPEPGAISMIADGAIRWRLVRSGTRYIVSFAW